MKTASAARIAEAFDDFLEAGRQQPVLITRKGKPVAVLLAVDDKAVAQRLAVRSRTLRSIFQEAHEQLERGEGIPHEQFWRAVARNRGKQRRARARANPLKAR